MTNGIKIGTPIDMYCETHSDVWW